jgi:hypothetical protein
MRECDEGRQIRRMLDEHLVVPLWPQAGQALELTRGQAYRGAAAGDIHTIRVGRLMRVPTTWLKAKLGIEPEAA